MTSVVIASPTSNLQRIFTALSLHLQRPPYLHLLIVPDPSDLKYLDALSAFTTVFLSLDQPTEELEHQARWISSRGKSLFAIVSTTVVPYPPRLPAITHIEGLSHLALLVHPNRLQVLLFFGELHLESRTRYCPQDLATTSSVTHYVRSLIGELKDTPVDFFIEREYNPSSPTSLLRHPNSIGMNLMLQYLWDCLPETRNPKCPSHTRVHYTDIRTLAPTVSTLMQTLSRFIDDQPPSPEDLLLFESSYQELLLQPNLLYQHALNLISSELKGIHPAYSSLSARLLKHNAYLHSPSFTGASRDVLSVITNFRLMLAQEPKDTPIQNQAWDVILSLAEYGLHLMDFYTVTRILHRFRRSSDRCRFGIVYAGAAHTRNLSHYFRDLGYSVPLDYAIPPGAPVCVPVPPSASLLSLIRTAHLPPAPKSPE